MIFKNEILPMLSIIIPVYNVENYIERCINSIISQEYCKWEIIAIDDGSKDSSGEILDCLSKIDNRIRVFHVKNGGVSKARNIGISKASGEYITFVDADDVVKSDIYIKMIKEAKKNQCDIVQCDYEELFENGTTNNPISSKKNLYMSNDEIIIACMERDIYANVFTKIYKREVIDKVRFDEKISYSEDLKFVVECCCVSKNISVLDFVGYQYFIRDSSADHSIVNENFLSILSVADFLIDKFKNNDIVYPYVEKNDVLQTKYLIDRISSQRGLMVNKLQLLRYRIINKRKIILNSNIYRKEDKIKILIIWLLPNFYYFLYYIYNKFVSKVF